MPSEPAVPALALGYLGPAGDHNQNPNEAVPQLLGATATKTRRPSSLYGRPVTGVEQSSAAHLDEARELLRSFADAVTAQLESGHGVVCVNGRCAASLATVPRVMSAHPEAVLVWFDAHADLNVPGGSSTDYLGGMAVSGPLGWWDSGLGAGLSPHQLVLVGTRSIDEAEKKLIDLNEISVLTPAESNGPTLAELVAGRPVYVHIDCDVLEPGVFTTDYREPDGLTLAQLEELTSALARDSVIIGVEIAEWEGDGTSHHDDLLSAIESLFSALDAAIDLDARS